MKTQLIGLALGLAACSPEVAFESNSLEKVNPRILADQEYLASRITPTSVTYQPLFGLVSEDLTLKEKPLLSRDFRQAERPLNIETYTQGYEGNTSTQEFEISAAGKVDLLLVIDNSGSMGEEQAELSTNLKSLIKNLESVDWQIGVITTDNCRLQNTRNATRAMRKSDPGIEATFESTIKGLGVSGSRDEQGVKTALQQISGKCVGSSNSWLRPDASFAVVFVSDEENECFGEPNCADDLGVRWGPNELITQMNSMRRADQLKAYALLWNKDVNNKLSRNAQCRRDAGVETYGARYSQIVEAFGGIERSICLDSNVNTNDYGPLLEQISGDVNRSVQREFTLKEEPVSNSLKILVDGTPARDVQVVGRKVILRNALATQIKLQVTYRHDPVPKFDRVVLKERPALESLDVKIADRAMTPDLLQYDEATGELIFLDVPGERQKIHVRYRSRLALPKDFDVKQIVASSGPIVTVSVNGRLIKDWGPTSNGETITFTEAPSDGAIVTVGYKPKDPRIRTYPIPSSHDISAVRAVTAKDKFTGELVTFSIEDGKFQFDDADIENGRLLSIIYDYGTSESRLNYQLPHPPIADSLEISSALSTDECLENIVIKERDVSFDCNSDSIDDVTIAYKYIEERFTDFKIDSPIRDQDIVQVFVDGGAIQNFSRNGQTVSIPLDQLAFNSKIRILVLENTRDIY